MKHLFLALNLIVLASLTVFAQNKPNKQATESFENESATRQRTVTNGESGNTPKESTDDILLESGTTLDAKLISTLDVRKSEVGDEVILKTTKSIKQNGEVIVPKGTKLIGRITEVKRKTKEDKTSKLSMVFETLENKDLTTPLNATIISIARAGGNVQAGDLFGTEANGNTRSSGTVSQNNSGGGGLLGGATGTVGGVLNTATNTVGSVTNTVGSTANGTAGTLGRTIDGIQISQSANVSAQGSSTLSAENKNIKLKKGTQFRLQVSESIRN